MGQAMPRYKLTLEYHGQPFVGWQRQRVGRSVQGTIEQALARLDPAPGPVQGAGRTDAGVHATGQVAHCDLARDWDPFRLSEALNHHLRPDPVAVLTAERAAPDFHARFDAVFRHYRYRIVCRRAPLALGAGLAWHLRHDLDLEPMRAAAAILTGRHDFTTFRSAHCQAPSPVRTLDHFEVGKISTRDHHEFVFELGARSFLHNQVRSLVGTLERVGAGKWSVNKVKTALEARARSACGPVAPPQGLTLVQVDYPTASK